jgi:hypothetical protein
MIALKTSFFVNTLAYASNPNELRVSTAFKYKELGIFVIEVEEYQPDPLSSRREDYRWSSYEGAGGLYWGNVGLGFFKMYTEAESSNFSSKGFEGKVRILAPTEGDLDRKAELIVNYNTERYSRGSTFGNLTVSCNGSSSCFTTSSQQELDMITHAIQQGEVRLHPLPDVRHIEYVFHFESNPEKYIVVDVSKLDKYSKSFEVMIWEHGKLTSEPVKKTSRYWDGGTTFIELENGWVIQNPSSLDSDDSPSIIDPSRNKTTLVRIPQGQVTSEFLSRLGLSVRYQQPVLRTPCELLFDNTSDIQ